MGDDFQVKGSNASALFTLTAHRGDGMVLLGMNWKTDRPPDDFVGFAIQYREPNGVRFFAVKNRLGFPGPKGEPAPASLSTLQSPIQKFRWVHFPRNAQLDGAFRYRVTPMFMGSDGSLSQGEAQEVDIELRRDTYPGQLNITFTRGFVSSQGFVDRFKTVSKLLPRSSKSGLTFTPTHPKAKEALYWMGFEAREAILDLLDAAIKDKKAQVLVVAYDFSLSHVVDRLEQLGPRLRIIIDDSKEHREAGAAENIAAERLRQSAGADRVKRQRMGALQHNKMIVVDSPSRQTVVFGSTNFSWRGFYVQNNNACIVHSKTAVQQARSAFEAYWEVPGPGSDIGAFPASSAAEWASLGLDGLDASVTFSPHGPSNAQLEAIADDIRRAKHSVFYSLAFLAKTGGAVREAIEAVTQSAVFVYGIADQPFGISVQNPDGNVQPVHADALAENLPLPFSREPTAGNVGTRMHHKFVVIDFGTPDARVYLGSYNFSEPADIANGENLLLIRDRRAATSYMVEALRIFDHYTFRNKQSEPGAPKVLHLKLPPKAPGELPWWQKSYTDPVRIRDRLLFS